MKNNHTLINPVLLSLAFLVTFSVNLFAQSNTEDVASFQHAKLILEKMSKFLVSAEHFSFHAEMTEDQSYDEGRYIESEITSDVVVQGSDKVFAEMKSDYNHKRFWYDGQKVTLLSVPANYYATSVVNGPIDDMTDFIYTNFEVNIPLVAFAFTNPYEYLMEGVTDGKYLGLNKANGVSCHHLLFIEEDVEWQIWIEVGNVIVPRKYTVTFMDDLGAPKFSASISNWDFSAFTPDALFNFTPPFGVAEIEFVNNNE